MTIVRELLIKLGFQTDKKAINETNRAIIGFKTRFAIVATSAAYAFKVIKNYFSDIAAATLDSNELARSLGLSLNELTALQQAALNFRISPEQFSGILTTLQKDLQDLQQGFGRLPMLLRNIGKSLPKNATEIELFETLIGYLREIDDEQSRIKIANEFFPGLGVKIADLAKNFDTFRDSTRQAFEALKDTPDITDDLREYEKSINNISVSWENFTRTISATVFPVLISLMKILGTVSEFYRNLFNQDATGIRSALQSASNALDPLFKITGLDTVSNFAKSFNGGKSLLESRIERDNPNITNNIQVNVPAGSTVEQANYMSSQIKQAVDESIQESFRQIQYNNPMVE